MRFYSSLYIAKTGNCKPLGLRDHGFIALTSFEFLYQFDPGCPASQVKKSVMRPDCSSAPTQRPCVSDLLLLKGKSWLRAETLDDSTPQRRISELRVWSYEPFIVFVPSSSGYTSGQNLKVLYILISETIETHQEIMRFISRN